MPVPRVQADAQEEELIRAVLYAPYIGIGGLYGMDCERAFRRGWHAALAAHLEQEQALLYRYMQWADQTFPDETLIQVAHHLVKEVAELLARPDSGEEHADVYLLAQRVVGLVRRYAEIAGNDLIAEAEAKLNTNMQRTWREGMDGVYEHIRESVDQ